MKKFVLSFYIFTFLACSAVYAIGSETARVPLKKAVSSFLATINIDEQKANEILAEIDQLDSDTKAILEEIVNKGPAASDQPW